MCIRDSFQTGGLQEVFTIEEAGAVLVEAEGIVLAIALAEAEEAVVDVVDLLLRPVAHEEVLQRLQQAGVQNAEQLVAGDVYKRQILYSAPAS